MVGSHLFFAAEDAESGRELWALPLAAVATTCVGDCDHDGTVTVDELVAGANIALGRLPVSACAAFDPDDSQRVTVDGILKAVNNALSGCR